MYNIEICPCCNSDSLSYSYGIISPFISHYVLGEKPSGCRFFTCNNCGFRFFEQRFDDDEVERLYDDYRGPEYFQVRHKYEPWYSESINNGIGYNEQVIAERKEQIKKFILANLSGKRRFNRILDYGGDRGQFIPDDISDERYVYEVSGVTPVPGVTLVDDIDSVGNDTFDVVILSMVLEHVSDPHVILNKIHEILTPDGYLVLEVPYEPFKYKNWFGNKTENYLNKLANSPEFILKAIDLYSTLFRIKFRYIPPLGFVKLHEHINFFSESSLHSLFQLNNFSVISIERHYQDTKSFINDSLLCLVKVEK